MLNLNRLTMLRELYRLGTLAKVAETLNYTPSAISQQLGVLEKETGVQLLEPVGRRVQLTDAALALVSHTERVLAQLELAEAELATGSVKTQLKLSAFQLAPLGLLPAALTFLAESHPEIAIEFTQGSTQHVYASLLAHELDIILGEEYPGIPEQVRSSTEREALSKDRLELLLPTSGAQARRPHSLADLAQAPFVMAPATSTLGQWSRNICREAGFEPTVTYQTSDPLLQLELISQGVGLGFLPAIIVEQHQQAIKRFVLTTKPERSLYTSVRVGRSNHPSVQACRQALIAAVKAVPLSQPVTLIPLTH